MANLGYIIPHESWKSFDRKFKKIFSDSLESKAKVKGIVLSCVQDYLSLKRGRSLIENIQARYNLPPYYNPDCWYPCFILKGFLSEANKIYLQSPSIKSNIIGSYVILRGKLPQREHLFGKSQRSDMMAFRNLSELLNLDNFRTIRKNQQVMALYFDGNVSILIKEFISGMCEGILNIRQISPVQIELDCTGSRTFINMNMIMVREVCS
jgi:hypothetical protein